MMPTYSMPIHPPLPTAAAAPPPQNIVYNGTANISLAGSGQASYHGLGASLTNIGWNQDFKVEGNLIVKGKNIVETLERIEEKLAIFKPNPELEESWEELRELARKYKELEQKILEKQEMWAILKK